jgi:tetratricopeptide (TPR) repeat protein
VHYYDPHDDYDPPKPFTERFAEDKYAGEVAFADAQVGALLETLRRRDLEEDTFIVVTGDHGEMLGEHGEATHGFFVYQSALRVPLVMAGPEIAPRVVSEWIGLADVAPTVAGLVGGEMDAPLDGHDLSALVLGGGAAKTPERRELYAESVSPDRYYGAQALHALVVEKWKYIHTARPELYDIDADPGETRDLVEENPDIVAGMQERIERILVAPDSAGSEAVTLDAEARERLAALGYLGGGGRSSGSSAAPSSSGERSDPKDWIEFHREHQRLEELVRDRSFEEAVAVARSLLSKKPDFAPAHIQLAQIASEQGERKAAVKHYERALELDPTNAAAHLNLGRLLSALGDLDSALVHLRRAAELDPGLAGADDVLAATLVASGNGPAAIEILERRVAGDPTDAEARFQLAAALGQGGRIEDALASLEEAKRLAPSPASPQAAIAHHRIGLGLRERSEHQRALEHFDRALELDPSFAMAHNDRGVTLKALGREEEALDAYQRAIDADPSLAAAYNNIGSLFGARRQIDEALRNFRRAVELDPDHAEAQNNLGLALRMTGARDEAVPHFRAALEARPDWERPMNELAWILATHPDASRRDPAEAVRLSERAVALAGDGQPVLLDTLAAAYAASGDFGRAVTTAERAVGLAAQRAPGLAAEMSARLALYRKGRAFREPAGTRAPG